MRPFIYQQTKIVFKNLRCDVSSAVITATELAAILYRSIDDNYKQHHKIDSKFSQHLILMVSPFKKDMASSRSHTADEYNIAREINASDIFAASESFFICLLPKALVQTDLKKVGGNATGIADIKTASVSLLVGEEYSAKILKRLPLSKNFKGWVSFVLNCI